MCCGWYVCCSKCAVCDMYVVCMCVMCVECEFVCGMLCV